MQRINQTRLSAHIVTIEDPIEFLYPKEKSLFIQREVGSDTRSYKDALRAAMRQDPDVIMLGEIRDYETAEICLKGSETGHLVLSAIHTCQTPSKRCSDSSACSRRRITTPRAFASPNH